MTADPTGGKVGVHSAAVSNGTPRVPKADPAIFQAMEKHSVTIAGHATSIRIESPFWDALLADARKLGVPVNALIAEIDVQRLAVDPPPNLASAIRLWVTARLRDVANP